MTILEASGHDTPAEGRPVAVGEPPESGETGRSGVSIGSVIGQLARSPLYLAVFAATATAVGVLYSILLTFAFTQRFSVANWRYLDAYRLGWTAALAVAMALVFTVQVYTLRRLAEIRTATLRGMAFVTGVLPSLLCCSPIIPNLLAFAGLSTVSVYSTTGTLQRFFATHETQFLAASLALLVVSGWWGLRRAARSACLGPEGCNVDGLGLPAAPDKRRSQTESDDSDGGR